jgi:beta-galactosidase
MKTRNLCVLLTGLLVLAGGVSAGAGRTRESFNSDWRFERFGPMPDGSSRAEPGAAGWTLAVTASSQETEHGNPAENALDGDPATRWCANDKGQKQWVQLDLGRTQQLNRALVQWEFPEKKYAFVIEGSNDGQAWQPLPGAVRFVRVRTTALPDGKWASIREIQLFDGAGQAIKNRRLAASGAPSTAAFDDSAWRKLDVPHDWGIEGPFRADLDNNTGKLPWKGIGWYRKHFALPAADQGQRIFVDFDGAMANAQVWLNGEPIGGWPYGYQPFRVELTDKVKFGAENVIAVRLDTAHWGSRWYPGAGLYRNVWLVKTAPVHVAHWGVFVSTPVVSDKKGEAQVTTTLENQGGQDAAVTLDVALLEATSDGAPGKQVARISSGNIAVAAGKSAESSLPVTLPNPKRWDLATPNLYIARVALSVGGQVVDVYDQPFGFRTIEFTARDGFKLNGRRVQLNGTCNHHDLGPLGAAFNTRAQERQLEILKEMGNNALRTSHNPPAPEFCELADRMGLLVQCEAFDCWRGGKTANDYAHLFDAWHEKDLQAMVRRERNHPSVIMWSIGNEIREQNGPELAKPLADIVRREDPTRPVTAGCNHDKAGINGFQTAVDVFGLNYHTGSFGKLLAHPGNEKKPMLSSESSSCISSRGEYFFPVQKGGPSRVNFQVSSYDVDVPGWAQTPDEEFAALDKNPAFAGEFVWTGFDYLGEPTPYNSDASNLLNFSDPAQRAAMQKELTALGKLKVPSASSYFGILDLCGFKKDRFYSYQARWRPELPMAHIFPHWNWAERTGQVTPVHVYTSGDAAELFLNGQSLGKKARGPFEYRLRWDDVVYQPGELKIVAYKKGKAWATDVVKTTGAAEQVQLAVDRAEIRADGRDLAFVTVTIADKDGLLVPRTHNPVKFTVSGPGELVAVGNGDAASHEPFIALQRKAFNGLCLAIVRAKSGQAGAIKLTAQADGLRSAEITIRSHE